MALDFKNPNMVFENEYALICLINMPLKNWKEKY